jgi:ABC-type glutathione transport system ATPase component
VTTDNEAVTLGAMATTGILGAPGSGKSAVAGHLREALPHHVVVDWDAFMTPAGALAGRDIRESPDTWPAYRDLIRGSRTRPSTDPSG